MSDEKKRTLAQVQQEYSNACAALGQIMYQMAIVQEEQDKREVEIEKLKRNLKTLNQEYSKLIEENKAAAQAEKAETLNEVASSSSDTATAG